MGYTITIEEPDTPLTKQLATGDWPSFVDSVKWGAYCDSCVSDDQECAGCSIFTESTDISEDGNL